MKERNCKNCGKPLIGENQEDKNQVEAQLCNECWLMWSAQDIEKEWNDYDD